MLLKQKGVALCAFVGSLVTSCMNEEDLLLPESQNLEADIEIYEDNDSRVSVNPESLKGTLTFYWNPSDEIGVFTNKSENNLKYVNTNQTENVTSVSFTPAEGVTVKGRPTYAYFPYSATSGTSYSSLSGNLPQNQIINANMDNIPGIYRYGSHNSTSSSVSSFTFRNLFSISRFKLDATGTELDGENLKEVDIAVTRNGSPLPVCGEFTFNARTGTYSRGSSTYNSMNIKFESEPIFDGDIIFLTSMFPTVRKNDVMTLTVHTTNYTATFEVKSTSSYTKNYLYTYNVALKNATNLVITKNEVIGDGDNTEEPKPEPEPEPELEPVAGTFTCATYNVDGLPDISYIIGSTNPDGPGASGTKSIGQKLATSNWDFIGFSEDFEYHSELSSAMPDYSFGKYRGSVNSSALTSTIDTDGLGFAAKKGVNFVEKAIVQFNSSHGGLTGGANTCIKKGFRHYEVTVADGVVVDVLITHMNTYSDKSDDYINAQHSQLTQIAQYINNLVATNNRPVIFMGDTNCRYTRHDFQTYFWSKLNSILTYSDPWVTYQWDNVYPTYPSKSLMVSDATGTDPDLDIICENTQKGEVVDKVIYINNANAPVQIKANSYLRDMNYSGLADHMPIVVEFAYELKQESGQTRSAYDSTFVNGGNAF